jgi:hypothetical protein
MFSDLVETNSESLEYNLVDASFMQPIMLINNGLYYVVHPINWTANKKINRTEF